MSFTLIDDTQFIHLDSVESTNTYLKNPAILAGTWVTAREQTQGRGRGQNRWIEIGAGRLILSAKITADLNQDISALPLLVGSAVLKSCQNYANVTLKWPNDIFRGDKKVAGVLIEVEKTNVQSVVIGVGVNIHGGEIPADLAQAGFLCEGAGVVSVEKLAREIITAINVSIPLAKNAEAISNEWKWLKSYSYLVGKRVTASFENRTVEGVFAGYSPRGELMLASGNSQFTISDAAYDVRAVEN